MFKLDLEKAEEPEIKLPTSAGSQKKQENSRKTSTSVSLMALKTLTVWITTNLENSSRDGNTRPPDLPLENLYAGQEATVRTRHGQRTVCKLGKEYFKAVCCHPVYLTCMQSTS